MLFLELYLSTKQSQEIIYVRQINTEFVCMCFGYVMNIEYLYQVINENSNKSQYIRNI